MAIWTPTQKMKTTKLVEKGTLRRYKVEIPEDRLEEAAQNTLVRLQLTARLPGFRAGKAPLDLIKRQLGDRARSEAVDDLIKQAIGDLINEQKIRPITMPTIKVTAISTTADRENKPQWKVTADVPWSQYAEDFYILKDQLETDGAITVRQFTPAQTTGLQTALADLIAAVA